MQGTVGIQTTKKPAAKGKDGKAISRIGQAGLDLSSTDRGAEDCLQWQKIIVCTL